MAASATWAQPFLKGVSCQKTNTMLKPISEKVRMSRDAPFQEPHTSGKAALITWTFSSCQGRMEALRSRSEQGFFPFPVKLTSARTASFVFLQGGESKQGPCTASPLMDLVHDPSSPLSSPYFFFPLLPKGKLPFSSPSLCHLLPSSFLLNS